MLLLFPFQKSYPYKGLFTNIGFSSSWTKPNSIQSRRGHLSSQRVNNISTFSLTEAMKALLPADTVGVGTTDGSKYVIGKKKEKFAFFKI